MYFTHFKGEAALRDLLGQLETYWDEFQALGSICVEANVRVHHPLTHDNFLVGEAARVDLLPADGRSALWLLSKDPIAWRSELRMPLLQQWLATRLGSPPSEIDVGFYFVNAGHYESHSFTDAEIEAAAGEVVQLVARGVS